MKTVTTIILTCMMGIQGFITALATPATPLPPELDGSMMPYDLSVNQSLPVAVADTLTPFFINYLGRHGARYLSSEKKVEKLRQFLLEAKGANVLTEDGEAFLGLLERVILATGDRWGALDSIGKEEQRELARQMHGLFPQLLKDGKVEARATYVPRVVMSMYEFCHELASLSPDLEIYTSEGKQNSPELRYFSVNPRYAGFLKDGDWREPLERFERANVPTEPASRLVKGGWCDKGDRLRDLTLDMYGVLQSLRATGMGEPTTRWMSEREYADCWRADNLDHFLRRTASALSPEPGIASSPLLQSFIEWGDKAVAGCDTHAMLRFAHAETLMPLFSLMRLRGCYSDSSDFDLVYREWKDSEVVPLGANLIVALMKGQSGRVYAAMRLNGKWVDPCGDGRLITSWDELREYWICSLRNLTEQQEKH